MHTGEQAHIHAVAGACLALGLKYAGSADAEVGLGWVCGCVCGWVCGWVYACACVHGWVGWGGGGVGG